jgi:hypothetical protein
MTAQLKFGVLALLEAQNGKEDELAAFGDTTSGIFDTFETEDGRQAHLDGET